MPQDIAHINFYLSKPRANRLLRIKKHMSDKLNKNMTWETAIEEAFNLWESLNNPKSIDDVVKE